MDGCRYGKWRRLTETDRDSWTGLDVIKIIFNRPDRSVLEDTVVACAQDADRGRQQTSKHANNQAIKQEYGFAAACCCRQQAWPLRGRFGGFRVARLCRLMLLAGRPVLRQVRCRCGLAQSSKGQSNKQARPVKQANEQAGKQASEQASKRANKQAPSRTTVGEDSCPFHVA